MHFDLLPPMPYLPGRQELHEVDLARGQQEYRDGHYINAQFSFGCAIKSAQTDEVYADANYLLGLMHRHGHGISRWHRTANAYFMEATKFYPHGPAHFALSEAYAKGKKWKWNNLEANAMLMVWHLRNAANAGYVPALLKLGKLYETGIPSILKKDKREAYYCYLPAYRQGHPEAIAILDQLGNRNKFAA